MPQFKYTALSEDGVKVSGVIQAFDEMDAADRIKQNADILLDLREIKQKRSFASIFLEDNSNKLNGKAFTVMCSQFAIILRSGIPISRAVRLIAMKTTDKPLRRVLGRVAEDVEAGRSLSNAFEVHGAKMLPVTFIETLRAGEESGDVAGAFEVMHVHYDKNVKTKNKIRAALSYPIFVLVIAVVVVAVLMVRVVPVFTDMFAEFGGELPVPTQILIAISNFFRSYWIVLAAAIAAIVLLIKLYGNTESGRLNLAKLQLRLPVLGNIAELNAAGQFANTMTTLLGAGLPLARTVSITAKVLSNYYISQEVGKLSGALEEGRTLAATMKEQAVMPDILVDMVTVGEESGQIESTMESAAAYYDEELDTATAAALAKLEPAMLIFLAVVAGFIVISVYMATFSIYDVMGA